MHSGQLSAATPRCVGARQLIAWGGARPAESNQPARVLRCASCALAQFPSIFYTPHPNQESKRKARGAAAPRVSSLDATVQHPRATFRDGCPLGFLGRSGLRLQRLAPRRQHPAALHGARHRGTPFRDCPNGSILARMRQPPGGHRGIINCRYCFGGVGLSCASYRLYGLVAAVFLQKRTKS